MVLKPPAVGSEALVQGDGVPLSRRRESTSLQTFNANRWRSINQSDGSIQVIDRKFKSLNIFSTFPPRCSSYSLHSDFPLPSLCSTALIHGHGLIWTPVHANIGLLRSIPWDSSSLRCKEGSSIPAAPSPTPAELDIPVKAHQHSTC